MMFKPGLCRYVSMQFKILAHFSMQLQNLARSQYIEILALLEDIHNVWNHRSSLLLFSIQRLNIGLLPMLLVTFLIVDRLHWSCYRRKKVAYVLLLPSALHIGFVSLNCLCFSFIPFLVIVYNHVLLIIDHELPFLLRVFLLPRKFIKKKKKSKTFL